MASGGPNPPDLAVGASDAALETPAALRGHGLTELRRPPPRGLPAARVGGTFRRSTAGAAPRSRRCGRVPASERRCDPPDRGPTRRYGWFPARTAAAPRFPPKARFGWWLAVESRKTSTTPCMAPLVPSRRGHRCRRWGFPALRWRSGRCDWPGRPPPPGAGPFRPGSPPRPGLLVDDVEDRGRGRLTGGLEAAQPVNRSASGSDR